MTIVAFAVGLLSIYENQASYTRDFSTIVRAARGATLSNEIASRDTAGTNPLPKYIADTTITFQGAFEGFEKPYNTQQGAESESEQPLVPTVDSRSPQADKDTTNYSERSNHQSRITSAQNEQILPPVLHLSGIHSPAIELDRGV